MQWHLLPCRIWHDENNKKHEALSRAFYLIDFQNLAAGGWLIVAIKIELWDLFVWTIEENAPFKLLNNEVEIVFTKKITISKHEPYQE